MSNIARTLAPIGVLLLGSGLAAAFIATRETPERKAVAPLPPRVEVRTVLEEDRAAGVKALGTVVAAEKVTLQPEVTGVARYVSPNLVPGGRVKKGELLVRIDPRNFRLAVEERKAQVAKAEFDLQVERGRQRVAKKEWELLEGETSGEADEALALRKPHLRNARTALEAARSALERAKLDLARTRIRAPFDAVVESEGVEIGQLLSPSAQVATLVGTDAFWVQTNLPIAELALLEMPGPDGQEGSKAVVLQESGPRAPLEREGRVVRLLGDLDPRGKMARVLVEVPDPLSRGPEGDRLPLLLGSVVRVELEGRPLEDVYVVPRLALHEGDRVQTVEDDELAIRPVDVVWRGRDQAYVRGPLGPSPEVVVSKLQTPVAGMKVRVEGDARAEAR
jgi:RND family efflux transporter MFP subunit